MNEDDAVVVKEEFGDVICTISVKGKSKLVASCFKYHGIVRLFRLKLTRSIPGSPDWGISGISREIDEISCFSCFPVHRSVFVMAAVATAGSPAAVPPEASLAQETVNKLLDFNAKLDIGLLDRVVATMYSGQGEQQKMAQEVLTTLKEHPDAWTKVRCLVKRFFATM